MSAASKKKLMVVALFVLVFVAMYMFDVIRAKSFHLVVEEMSPTPAVADGQSPVTIRVKLVDRHNRPVEGHSIFALAHSGGMFHSLREITDENGRAEYTYYPYKVSGVTKLKDAQLSFTDESNSVFIEIGTTTKVTLPLSEPKQETASQELLNGIFGE